MTRNRDTSAATAANIKRKHDRWVKELRDAGWFCAPRDLISEAWKREPEHPASQIYATDYWGRTYRVMRWDSTQGDRRPVFANKKHEWVGTESYLFTHGPR